MEAVPHHLKMVSLNYELEKWHVGRLLLPIKIESEKYCLIDIDHMSLDIMCTNLWVWKQSSGVEQMISKPYMGKKHFVQQHRLAKMRNGCSCTSMKPIWNNSGGFYSLAYWVSEISSDTILDFFFYTPLAYNVIIITECQPPGFLQNKWHWFTMTLWHMGSFSKAVVGCFIFRYLW